MYVKREILNTRGHWYLEKSRLPNSFVNANYVLKAVVIINWADGNDLL